MEAFQLTAQKLKLINDWTGSKMFNRIFSSTIDGMNNVVFHNKIDNKGPILALIKSDLNKVFGGYVSVNIASQPNGVKIADPKAFLFTLTDEIKFPVKN